MGILSTGLQPFGHIQYSIPPKVDQFHTYGVCNTSLFSGVWFGTYFKRQELSLKINEEDFLDCLYFLTLVDGFCA